MRRTHEASLQALKRTGLRVDEPEALALFGEAGVDVEGNRIRLPRSVVEGAVDKAHSRTALAGREPEHDLILWDTRAHIGTVGIARQVLDQDTGGRFRRRCWATFGALRRTLENLEVTLCG